MSQGVIKKVGLGSLPSLRHIADIRGTETRSVARNSAMVAAKQRAIDMLTGLDLDIVDVLEGEWSLMVSAQESAWSRAANEISRLGMTITGAHA